MAVGNRVFAQSDEMGALPTLYAATQDLPGGSYVGPDGFARDARPPDARRAQRGGERPGDRPRLWDLSEQLTGVAFPLAPRAAPSVTEAAH